MIHIDRCYCEDKLFSDLIAIARQEGLDLMGLAQQEGCGTHCGWCVAYLRRALISGDASFSELFPKESLRLAQMNMFLDAEARRNTAGDESDP
jgi:bacterioferritin-associated ferredoxin